MRGILRIVVRRGSWKLPKPSRTGESNHRDVVLSVQISHELVEAFPHNDALMEQVGREYLDEKKISTDKAWPVLQSLAYECRVEKILRELHKKKRWFIDIGLVNNPATPKHVLEFMAYQWSPKGYPKIYKNKEIRAKARRRLIPEKQRMFSILRAWRARGKKKVPWHITEAGWKYYLNHPNPRIRALALRHPYRRK